MRVEKPIANHTRVLGPPPGMDNCGSLAIRDEDERGIHMMASAWTPSADELAVLNAGGSVVVRICGHIHPPISVGVEA